jgi:hypothetical protein
MVAIAESKEGSALRRSVKVERYAEVLAHVVHFGAERTEAVVRRFGLTLDAWRALDEAWSEDLAEAIRRNQQDLALRFSATFAKRRRRLAKEQPAVEAVGDARVTQMEAGAPVASGGPVTAQVAVPSFMAAPRPADRAAAVAPTATPVPVPVVVPAQVGALGVAAPSEPPPAPAASMEKPVTQAMPAVSQVGDRLPFAGEAAADVALKAARDHAENVQGPRPAKGAALGMTAPTGEGERLAAIARRILPFQPGGGGRDAQPSPTRESDPGPPPGAPAAPTEGVGLTLEQHASLHVELGLHPEQRLPILRRYGIGRSSTPGWTRDGRPRSLRIPRSARRGRLPARGTAPGSCETSRKPPDESGPVGLRRGLITAKEGRSLEGTPLVRIRPTVTCAGP